LAPVFAGAVGTEEAEELAGFGGKIDAIDGGEAAGTVLS
jgi:hypothetical protein